MTPAPIPIDTVIIGAGQAGLAVSWHLQADGRDHVVLDRGRVAERWRSERWDSLRTLTPNWMTRLPGAAYTGDDPDGFMTMPELVDRFEAYARSFDAPVVEGVAVRSVTIGSGCFTVAASDAQWRARNVVIATGWADQPYVPAAARRVAGGVQQLTPATYRRPDQIEGNGVLVVGASASGAQIALELADAGHDVTIAVGRHRRVPWRYRGHDIMWWLDRLGVLDRVPSDEASRRRLLREPSLQLCAGGSLDLATLECHGVTVTGRLNDIIDGSAVFAPDLHVSVADSEARLCRLLRQIDRLAGEDEGETITPMDVRPGPDAMTLGRSGVEAIVWATGYRRSYPWLHVPVLDAAGDIQHDRGVTPVDGLYVVGMRFQSGRRSTFIDGARHDAEAIAGHIVRRSRRLAAA